MEKVSDRVAKSISSSSVGKQDIANRMDISWHTVHRWSKGEKEGLSNAAKKELLAQIESIVKILKDSL